MKIDPDTQKLLLINNMKIIFLGLFLISKKWSFYDHFGKMSRVAPGYSQMSCFDIAFESALDKHQNGHKKSNIWKPLEIICDAENSNGKKKSYNRLFPHFHGNGRTKEGRGGGIQIRRRTAKATETGPK